MIELDASITKESLAPKLERLWEASGKKILAIERDFDLSNGAPVFTIDGRYTTRGWTEWTQGFQFGSALLQFDATGEEDFLEMGRRRTLEKMAPHVTHFGVHDHGFNNVSTYGTLLRLMNESRIDEQAWERSFYEMALKASGSVQASRWTAIEDGDGFVYSFNGPHSLFADTVRSMRVLALAHDLGHVLSGENDTRVSLLDRLVRHLRSTARYSVYYGEGRDGYDVRGRVAHESIFNVNDGRYRCPNSQQGYSPFSTWTRGLAWIICGFAEQIEWIQTVPDEEMNTLGGREEIESTVLRALGAACDFYLENTPACGVPYWDTGAPGLRELGNYLDRPADPYNNHEPVDSSAAAIASQGLLRYGRYLNSRESGDGARYWQAGLRILDTLLSEPYLSTDPAHDGLLRHAVYHWPNRWDHVPDGCSVACGEAVMWGDFHIREAGLYFERLTRGGPYLTFFGTREGVDNAARAARHDAH